MPIAPTPDCDGNPVVILPGVPRRHSGVAEGVPQDKKMARELLARAMDLKDVEGADLEEVSQPSLS